MRAATQTSTLQDRQAEPPKMSDLIGELATSSAALVRDEVDLARQEIKENLRRMSPGVVAVAVGIVIANIGLVALSAAAVIALAGLIGYGWSALVIGAVLCLIGGSSSLLGLGRLRRTRLRPEQTMETLEENKVWLKLLR